MSTTPDRVRARLDRVTDPELDESIVELGYLDRVDVDGSRVTVEFTLPTAWCSPAFAWMMATDARDEIETLPDVAEARVYLRDHMHETEINTGVNERRSFAESFPDADGDVASVRATLDDKARLARQHAAVETLLDAGVSAEQLCALTAADVEFDGVGVDRRAEDARAAVYLAEGAFAVAVAARPLDRYLRKAREVGVIDADDEPLFRTPEGDPIAPDAFELVRRRGRLARTNMTGQGGVCDALNESRRRKLGRTDRETADAD